MTKTYVALTLVAAFALDEPKNAQSRPARTEPKKEVRLDELVERLSKPAPPETFTGADRPAEIHADSVDDFHYWTDARTSVLAFASANADSTSAELISTIEDELRRAGVDHRSFLVRGEKNLEFPQMLYRTEFVEYPLYRLTPGVIGRKLRRVVPEAGDVDRRIDDVLHSGFFTHVSIESFTPERLARQVFTIKPQGSMKITKVKEGRTSEGIWIKDERGRKYIVLFDSPFTPESGTSAEFIGSTLCRMLGFHVPKTCVTTIQGTGDRYYDGRRAVATEALKDFDGGYRYGSFRSKRPVRALQLVAAWVNNVDMTEQNSGVTKTDAGSYRHYALDFGASLGSFTFRPQPARLGWTKLFDPLPQLAQPIYDRGIIKPRWPAPYELKSLATGTFSADFDPDRWQPFYQNMAFVEISEADRVWAARLIARVTDDQIRAVVDLAEYSHSSDADYVADTLIKRRDAIVNRYLKTQSGALPKR